MSAKYLPYARTSKPSSQSSSWAGEKMYFWDEPDELLVADKKGIISVNLFT